MSLCQVTGRALNFGGPNTGSLAVLCVGLCGRNLTRMNPLLCCHISCRPSGCLIQLVALPTGGVSFGVLSIDSWPPPRRMLPFPLEMELLGVPSLLTDAARFSRSTLALLSGKYGSVFGVLVPLTVIQE